MSDPIKNIDQLAINTIRTLSMDAVQKANSGHPGTPMALAPLAYVIWNDFLAYDPACPAWPARDRFVLSAGHASMLLYSVLHLAGVKQTDPQGRPTQELAVPLEHIKNFRQLHSRCPGHPERGETSGVETTTGPLGQGLGNSVGMAIAQKWHAARFHRPGFEKLLDYNVYAICGDGDLMEGVSAEAASLAGHLQLDNLCWIYDANKITIEGNTDLAFTEDVLGRFRAYGWQTISLNDVNDLANLRSSLKSFLAQKGSRKPTFIMVKSQIAYGAPHKQNTHGAHGAPLGAEEIRLTKAAYGWPPEAQFLVPDEVPAHLASTVGKRGGDLRRAWEKLFAEYRKQYPNEAQMLDQMQRGELPADWAADIKDFPADAKGNASRNTSAAALNQVGKRLPWLLGGSADLAESTKTVLTFPEAGEFLAQSYAGRNFHFGIREHAMGSILNGMALSGLRAYGSTFLVFSDYCRPAMRLSALMQLPVIYIFTHDSIGVGEDGPTHQPIEHLAALRCIPNMLTIRPADANEVAEAWRRIIIPSKTAPVSLVLTRQNLPTLDRTKYAQADGVAKGAYTLIDAPDGKPQVILLASGSEVSLCTAAYDLLHKEGIAARVVSMPCWELFERQAEAYRDSVLPPDVTARVGVEMGCEQGWAKYLGLKGRFIGMNRFGASAPAEVLAKEFGFTAENVARVAKETLGK